MMRIVRASRLVSILLLLQTRDRVTADELAATLEVSVRTIYRDMESLAGAGVPLYGEAGHAGGYRLLGGFRTRLNGLTTGEAESLFLTGLPSAAADLGLGAVVTAAQLKLMAALPGELRDRAGRIAERFHLDAPAWYRDADRTPHLTGVADAVWNERAIRVRYLRWAEPHEVERVIEPLGLVLKGGHWYVIGRTDGHLRTYRVSRIIDLVVLDSGFERPAGFDLEAYWRAYLESFDARRLRVAATVRLSAAGMERLPYVLEMAGVEAARRTAAPGGDGWTRVTLPMESVAQAASVILGFGADAEVVGPDELRERVARIVRDLGRVYATTD